ncbi:Vacuolar amino acid transporter 3 [Phytophthora ramorum]|uniref:Vacuolar amino acid transporter 3 n=1 Tax=Phytophthora ramorum TaxID=164328 RepID=UPI0030B31E36|nr:Vacuolar amino acid transporter 3 [Phytophthora ramorum]
MFSPRENDSCKDNDVRTPALVHDIAEEGSDMTREIYSAVLKGSKDGMIRTKSLPDVSEVLYKDVGKASDIAQPGGFRRDHVIANLPVGDTVVPTYVQKSFLTSIGATGLLQSAYCGFVNDTLHLGDEQSESEELIPLFNSLDTIHAVKSETSPRGASVKKTIFTIFKSFIALSTFCMLRLVECSSVLLRSRNHHNISYGIVGEKAFGNLGRRAVNVSLVLSQIGFCCSYLIFVEKNIGEVLLHAFNVGSSTTTSSWTLILLQIPLYTPLASSESLGTMTVQLTYSLALVLSYPLMLYPVINVLESNLFPYQRIKGFWRWKKNAFRFALVCLTAVIGYFGKDELDNFVSIIGGFCSVPLAFIYPCMFHSRLVCRGHLLNGIVIAIGLCTMVFATYQAVSTWN